MGYSQVALCNMALASFGGVPIQTMDESTPSGTAVSLIYPLVMRGLFAEYPWNFAQMTVTLGQLAATPLADGLLPSGWQYAYALPADLIGLPEKLSSNSRYPDGPETRFEIQGQTIFTNQVALWCKGTFYVDEMSWPDYFTSAAVACLAAEVYMAISGNGSILPALQQKAWGAPEQMRRGGLLGLAKLADSRAQPSRVNTQNPLIDVRTSSFYVVPSGQSLP